MIQKTRWSPDTCKCVVDYEWDDAVSQDNRVHSLSKIVKKCKDHELLSDQQIYDALFEENPRKNKALAEIVKSAESLTKLDAEGQKVLKDGVVNWSFDSARKLTITIPSLSAGEKNTLQTSVDSKVGSDKVLIG